MLLQLQAEFKMHAQTHQRVWHAGTEPSRLQIISSNMEQERNHRIPSNYVLKTHKDGDQEVPVST